jgi:hypothetical protein
MKACVVCALKLPLWFAILTKAPVWRGPEGELMLSVRLIRMIEDHAEQLTEAILRDLGTNALTPSYHNLSREELYRRTYDVLRNFTRWLSYEADSAFEKLYAEVGRGRCAEGIPLSELIQALLLTKYHLNDYLRSVGLSDSALELYQRLEIFRLIGRFFDKAIYFAARGYEQQKAARPEMSLADAR